MCLFQMHANAQIYATTSNQHNMKHLPTYAILLLIIAGLVWLATHQQSELKRTRANWQSEVQDLGRQQDVTQRELVHLYDVTDSLQAKLNIKPKQITQYIKFPVQYRDTGSVKIITRHDTVKVYPDSITGVVRMQCYDLSILLYKGTFYTDLQYKDDIEVVLYRIRPRKLWFIRYGKWQNEAALISSCRDTVYKAVRNVKVLR